MYILEDSHFYDIIILEMLLKLLVTFTYLGMVAVNAMANILPINGVTTGGVSDSYPNLFAPAGITFSIWGLIYLLLGAHVLYQLGLLGKEKDKKVSDAVKKISKYFIGTSIINSIWIFAWHYNQIGLTLVLMVGLLILLIKIADITNTIKLDMKQRLLVKCPFSVYFGWITVATIANVTTLLVSLGWNGFGISAEIWTIIVLIVGAAIGTWRMLKDRNIAYGMVLVWAYLGIFIKHYSLEYFNQSYPLIMLTVGALGAVFIFTLISLSVKKK